MSAISSTPSSPNPDVKESSRSGSPLSTPMTAVSADALRSLDVALKRAGGSIRDSQSDKTPDRPSHPYRAGGPFKDNHQYTIGLANFDIDYLTNRITSLDDRESHIHGTDICGISGSTLRPMDKNVSCGLIRIIPKASEEFPWWKVDGWTGVPASDKTYEQKTYMGLLWTGTDGETTKITLVSQDSKKSSVGPGDVRYLCQTLDIASTEGSDCEAQEVRYHKGKWGLAFAHDINSGHLPSYCVKDTLSEFSDLTNQIIKDENTLGHGKGVVRHTMLTITDQSEDSGMTLILTASPAVKAFKVDGIHGSESIAIVSGATVLALLSG